jgi:hypothetical protein
VATQRTKVPTASPAKQIAGFVAKFDPKVAALIRACRRELRKRFPTATEVVYDNYNFLVFGFSTTGRPSDTIVSLAAAANGVGLSFYNGAKVPDPKGILLGSGSQNRFVRLPSVKTLSDPDVTALIAAATKLADPPLPTSGKGTTVVKSISAKQRPRR